jgi:hypothetical protein
MLNMRSFEDLGEVDYDSLFRSRGTLLHVACARISSARNMSFYDQADSD